MAINRYSNFQSVDWSETPIFQPDWKAIDETLALQQKSYDGGKELMDLPIDAFGQEDKTRAGDIIAGRQTAMDQIADLYATQGINAGNRALSKLKSTIKQDYLNPNSYVSNIQSNAAAIRTKIEEIGKWNAPSDLKKIMENKVVQTWKGTVNPDGSNNTFSGDQLTDYKNPTQMALELASKMSPTELEQSYGLFRDSGGYYRWEKEKKVFLKEEEIVQVLTPILATDPFLSASLQQEVGLRLYEKGVTPENFEQYKNITNAALLKEISETKDPKELIDLKTQLINTNTTYDDYVHDKKKNLIDTAAGLSGAFYKQDHYYNLFNFISDLTKPTEYKDPNSPSSNTKVEEALAALTPNLAILTTTNGIQLDKSLDEYQALTDNNTEQGRKNFKTFSDDVTKAYDKQIEQIKSGAITKAFTDVLAGAEYNGGKGYKFDVNPFSIIEVDHDNDGVTDAISVDYSNFDKLQAEGKINPIDYSNSRTALAAKEIEMAGTFNQIKFGKIARDTFIKVWSEYKNTDEYAEQLKEVEQIITDPAEYYKNGNKWSDTSKWKEEDQKLYKQLQQEILYLGDTGPKGPNVTKEERQALAKTAGKAINDLETKYGGGTKEGLGKVQNKLWKDYVKSHESVINAESHLIDLTSMAATGDAKAKNSIETINSTVINQFMQNIANKDQVYNYKDPQKRLSLGKDSIWGTGKNEIKAVSEALELALDNKEKQYIFLTLDNRVNGKYELYYVMDPNLKVSDTDPKGKKLDVFQGKNTSNAIMIPVPSQHVKDFLPNSIGINAQHELVQTQMVEEALDQDGGFYWKQYGMEVIASRNLDRDNTGELTDNPIKYDVKVNGINVEANSPFAINQIMTDVAKISKLVRALKVSNYTDEDIKGYLSTYLDKGAWSLNKEQINSLTDTLSEYHSVDNVFIDPTTTDEDYKYGLAAVESKHGKIVDNPNSTAVGKYQFILPDYDEPSKYRDLALSLLKLPARTPIETVREKLRGNPDAQEKLMTLAIPTQRAEAQAIINQLGLKGRTATEIMPLVHFMGYGNALKYLNDYQNFGSEIAEKQFLDYNSKQKVHNSAVNKYIWDFTEALMNKN